MRRYRIYILFIINVIIIFFFIWFFFIKEIKPQTIKNGLCLGHHCTSIGCNGNNCVAPDCIGESCKAGDCVGTKCKAGDCYGYNCEPGKCLDPKCKQGTCPQQNKVCTDGISYEIKRPFYYKYTKILPYGTILNPPLCSPNLDIKELKNGRAMNIGIYSLNVNNIGSVPYNSIFTNQNIKDNNLVNSTYPLYQKNDNCQICINDKCENKKD